MTDVPVLTRWFEIMDSDTPARVLDMITDDFVMSVQFSRGAGASAEFVGDRAGLEAYLEQRAVNTFVHHVISGAAVDGTELVLGKTTRDGEFAASFNATAQVVGGAVRRLLICRTPGVAFD